MSHNPSLFLLHDYRKPHNIERALSDFVSVGWMNGQTQGWKIRWLNGQIDVLLHICIYV